MLFGADVQQTDAGALKIHAVAGIRGSHQGKAQQIIGIGTHIGAHVEHHVKALRIGGGIEHGNRGAVHARQFTQPYHRHRHERAGIAAGNSHSRLATAHRFDGRPHGAVFAGTHNLTGLVVHGDDIRGVTYLATVRQLATFGDQRLQLITGTMQDKTDVGICCRRKRTPGNNCCRAFVTPHRVDRDQGVSGFRVGVIGLGRHQCECLTALEKTLETAAA